MDAAFTKFVLVCFLLGTPAKNISAFHLEFCEGVGAANVGSCARKPFVLVEHVGTVGTLLPTNYHSAAWNMLMMTMVMIDDDDDDDVDDDDLPYVE